MDIRRRWAAPAGENWSKARLALLVADAFAAVTAVGGGIALAAGLEGDRFPVEWLSGTPFRSYVVPGVILTIVGGSAAVAAVVTLRGSSAGGAASVLAGVVMMGWIAGELLILQRPLSAGMLWEVSYFALGLLMVGLGRQVARHGWRT